MLQCWCLHSGSGSAAGRDETETGHREVCWRWCRCVPESAARGLSHTALLSLPRRHTGAGAAGTPGLKQEVDMGHLYAMEWMVPPSAQEMETTILATKEEESAIAWPMTIWTFLPLPDER